LKSVYKAPLKKLIGALLVKMYREQFGSAYGCIKRDSWKIAWKTYWIKALLRMLFKERCLESFFMSY
jgi:hypothetical protein